MTPDSILPLVKLIVIFNKTMINNAKQTHLFCNIFIFVSLSIFGIFLTTVQVLFCLIQYF